MARKTTAQVTTIGIDIGKNTFHLIGLDADGNIVLRRKFSRSQMMVRLANMPPCLIGMESRQANAFKRVFQHPQPRSDFQVPSTASGADLRPRACEKSLIAEFGLLGNRPHRSTNSGRR